MSIYKKCVVDVKILRISQYCQHEVTRKTVLNDRINFKLAPVSIMF